MMGNLIFIFTFLYLFVSYIGFYIFKAIISIIKNETVKSIIGCLFESIDCIFLLYLIDMFIYEKELILSWYYNLYNVIMAFICTIIMLMLTKLFKIKNFLFEPFNIKTFIIYFIILGILEGFKYYIYLLHYRV